MSSMGVFEGERGVGAPASGSFPTIAVQRAANENSRSTPPSSRDQSGLLLDWSAGEELEPSVAFSTWQGQAKRLLDIVAACFAILVLAPLLLLVALAIKLESPGPIFFRQDREGKDKVPFQVLKFRSMRVEQCDMTGVRQTTADDPRVTKIGRVLRRTSIDELPQLFNVLRGDMSLVGPRPHVAGMLAGGVEYRALVDYYDLRLLVKPGLTGWAQANGLRGPTTNAALARRRVDHDLAYVQNFSLWLDLKIIFKTLHRELISSSGH